MSRFALLNCSDPHPLREHGRKNGASRFLLVGDHAGSCIPEALGDLGLSHADRNRHIALDLGVEELGRALADRLDTVFLSQAYSRLVVDCNRRIDDPDCIVERSDGSIVPGNRGLDAAHRAARLDEIYHTYHAGIASELDRRDAAGIETVFVSLHSFTPSLGGTARPWEVGVLHDGHRDDLARSLLQSLPRTGVVVGDNEPYRMDATDYTVPHHAFERGLRYLELEFRQDILATRLPEMADTLAALLLVTEG
ncbi:N-formylglutamate amidohydrolase [Erythrobacter arachoides]|uniref:N-formylglutamate amidohydrolase n=1 Tax=Aurantiacibacter arachoides TaxID=1850444 RepID=A0A845A9Z0_9SPHN|nr:N-formylglutamate amidohydrolase [Aurantiacibacter arachoides]MXO94379.1 N-formylglutamate amidohydrolase [Aurantiacibacter arachoides]GGD63932.1 N-formylglutamate amidohydrolase [Aurantiacibacter arachoides]